ncbi:UDP-3-O-acyl-N-acetylglucosamine deacetylase [Methylacidiphilum kamchatkense]|nr:UDP-3-O-acyl-N-acetylglucosamine deacetylase [Methylacidiphilum kamchatkense]
MQRTIREPVSVEGLSLHTGNPVRIVIKPADADSGYVFKRVDLPDEPTVQVSVDNVKQTERATTIGEGNVKVHTVEHVLAALRGCGVDNALIELNANEPPIGDGSGMFLVNEILKVGTVEQDKPVSFFELREPVWVEGEDGAYIAAWPDQNFSISCTHVSHTGLFTQYFSWKYDIKSFVTDIAPARTFVFYEELVPLIEKGLIKGGSLDNAIVIRGGTIYSQQPLRFENEFVRHKIFDMIGDFALFPKRLKARIVAARPSHFLNVKFIREIQKAYKNYLSHLMPLKIYP